MLKRERVVQRTQRKATAHAEPTESLIGERCRDFGQARRIAQRFGGIERTHLEFAAELQPADWRHFSRATKHNAAALFGTGGVVDESVRGRSTDGVERDH